MNSKQDIFFNGFSKCLDLPTFVIFFVIVTKLNQFVQPPPHQSHSNDEQNPVHSNSNWLQSVFKNPLEEICDSEEYICN